MGKRVSTICRESEKKRKLKKKISKQVNHEEKYCNVIKTEQSFMENLTNQLTKNMM